MGFCISGRVSFDILVGVGLTGNGCCSYTGFVVLMRVLVVFPASGALVFVSTL
jgi:hypothetical protein